MKAHLGPFCLHVLAAMHIMAPRILLVRIHPLIKKGRPFKMSPISLLHKQYKQMFFLILPSTILKFNQNLSSIALL